MTTSFSIIIPNYNYALYLPRALDSVLSQLNPHDELIIVDDGSTDDSPNIIKNYQKMAAPGQVKTHFQTNQGAAAARNQGVALAKNDYIIFLDADDALCEKSLAILRDYAFRYPNIDGFIGQYWRVKSDGSKKLSSSNLLTTSQENFINYLIKRKINITNGALMLKRTVFSQLRFPAHLSSAEDISFFSLLLANYNIMAIPQALVTIYHHPGSLRHDVKRYLASASLIKNEIFNETLPSELLPYAKNFEALRLLSLFRILYINQKYQQSRQIYWQALRLKPFYFFKLSYLGKYIKSFFK